MIIPRGIGAALILGTLATPSLAQTEERSVAVLSLSAKGVSKSIASNVADIVATHLSLTPGYKVISSEDLKAMVGLERMKDTIGCTDDSCLAEMGGALGVDYLIAGSVGKLGSTLTITLSLVNTAQAETLGRAQKQVTSEDGLPNAARAAVEQVTGLKAVTAAGGVLGKGGLFIQSKPAGAKVYIDGRRVKGKTPLTIDEVTAGDHVVRVTLNKLRRDIPVLVKTDQITKYQIPLKIVRVKITSAPFDADVHVDGEHRGKTPVLLPEMPAGEYEFEFKKKGFATLTTKHKLDFEAFQKTKVAQVVSGTLKALPVPVTITSEPSEAEVLIKGVSQGQTPLTLKKLLPTQHHKIDIQKKGYQAQNRKLHLKPGEPSLVQIKLKQYQAHADYQTKLSSRSTYSLTSGLIGAGLSAGAGAMYYLYSSKLTDADNFQQQYLEAVDQTALTSARDQRDQSLADATTFSYALYGFAGAGAVALGTALYLTFITPTEPDYKAETKVISIIPNIDPDKHSASLTGVFSY